MGWTGYPGGPPLQLGWVTLGARPATARPASGRRPDRARAGWLRPRRCTVVGGGVEAGGWPATTRPATAPRTTCTQAARIGVGQRLVAASATATAHVIELLAARPGCRGLAAAVLPLPSTRSVTQVSASFAGSTSGTLKAEWQACAPSEQPIRKEARFMAVQLRRVRRTS